MTCAGTKTAAGCLQRFALIATDDFGSKLVRIRKLDVLIFSLRVAGVDRWSASLGRGGSESPSSANSGDKGGLSEVIHLDVYEDDLGMIFRCRWFFVKREVVLSCLFD